MNELSLIKRFNKKMVEKQERTKSVINNKVDIFLCNLDFQYIENGRLYYESSNGKDKILSIEIYRKDDDTVTIFASQRILYTLYQSSVDIIIDDKVNEMLVIAYLNNVLSDIQIKIIKNS